jgi:hypothetical protein
VWQYEQLLQVTAGGTYSYHEALNGYQKHKCSLKHPLRRLTKMEMLRLESDVEVATFGKILSHFSP